MSGFKTKTKIRAGKKPAPLRKPTPKGPPCRKKKTRT